ncbi:AAA15 family ATPase/GTPase [Parabacteroides sp. PFB2-10]|uniref:AAA family ATPase n=1 Tax=Parabacteroides sp. PFB2-10 TaxID=1742405 RepID=UPI0024762473|nr:AAA family ATPase [Parabacteroides sp. PFB2-10]MDH6312377.1 AAA15 family ATPase/GTPase [Parabacteroides sp. PFB2-10]
MKKIDKIRIQNFKAFPEFQEFDLKGKNLLIYGNNGSGKSSLYWALYTLLQSCEKTVARVNDYFVVYDEANDRTFESLRNIFSQEPDSFIEIELQGEPPIRIAHGNIGATQTANIKEANKASDFINYKLLHNFYNSTHKSQLNIWSVFKHDIFPYFSFDGKAFSENLNNLYNNLPKTGNRFYRRNSSYYNQYQQKIAKFNNELQTLIVKINIQANKVLKDKFEINDIEVLLEYAENLKWDENYSRRFSDPEIKLSIKVKKDGGLVPNHRPQSFLNEAALTRIAISIRLGALQTRLEQSDWKILVLDDMLISLDMSNRMIISKIILEDNDLSDFQKIILTHDKGFFDILKSKTDSSEWEYLEFYKDEKTINSRPRIKVNKTEFEKAKEYFEESEFDACANYLRKEAEKILKHYLNKELNNQFETLSNLIGQAKNKIDSDRLARFNKLFKKGTLPLEKLKIDFEADTALTLAEKGQLRTLRAYLINFLIEQNEQEIQISAKLDELRSIKDRILNPGSHRTSMPYYEQELKDAIQIVEQLYVLLNPAP